jgi:replicative DNA helicase
MDIKNNEVGFAHLGVPYQKRLIAQFINDYKFASNIMDIIDPNYFSDNYLRIIVAEIKSAHETNEVIPDFDALSFRLAGRNDNETSKLFINAQLEEIKNVTLNDYEYVQDRGLKFCQQQELKKSVRDIQEIIDKGDLDDYPKCEEILKKALEIGGVKDDGMDIFHNIEMVLAEDFRLPIPTGIHGLDAKMNGGLAPCELGVILAPFGVGKTTMMTKIGNSAFIMGKRVLQIFFEDMPKVIQRKHLSCFTGIELNELGNPTNREIIDKAISDNSNNGGELILKKFPSDGTTIPIIRQYIRKLAASGRKPDVILLDYIDCVVPSKNVDNEWTGEGAIMRQFETLLSEFDMVGWTAIQGNRGSIGAAEVDSTMIGGAIKKGQIAHFLVSIAKSLEQKETGRANMAILKSRFGIDGIIFDDVLFDNARIQIEIESGAGLSTSQSVESKDIAGVQRVKFMMEQLELDRKEKTEI